MDFIGIFGGECQLRAEVRSLDKCMSNGFMMSWFLACKGKCGGIIMVSKVCWVGSGVVAWAREKEGSHEWCHCVVNSLVLTMSLDILIYTYNRIM